MAADDDPRVVQGPISKKFYERKRGEGKGHKQAVLALASTPAVDGDLQA
jgi:hypothetical protein